MKKLLLAMGLLLLPGTVHAAESTCTAAPTCESLGYKYTAKSCTTLGLKYVSCPFDATKVACVSNLPGESSGNTNTEDACKAAGYPYSAAQCGKKSFRQIGIPCPYSSDYYYCDYPNQNATTGGYLCTDGTAASSVAGCGGAHYVAGVVLREPSTYQLVPVIEMHQCWQVGVQNI